MGLFGNLRLLLSASLLSRMTEIENRQDLLEEHVEGRLDSMKQYSARVAKRERDARRGAVSDDQPGTNGQGWSPAALKLMERRQRRHRGSTG